MTFAKRILDFYEKIKIEAKLPAEIEVMNPYQDAYARSLCEKFYNKYYNDSHQRVLLVGINPGRFGSGATGISFTDPIKLEKLCGIPNTLIKKPELSADFIYTMIEAYGGIAKFYSRYFISAVSPLGFTKEGKNINYYDDRTLQTAITPFVIESITALTQLEISRDVCYCIGEGKNLSFLTRLNEEHRWFKQIIPLAHPRFIMQYKRKHIDAYVGDYLRKLSSSPYAQ